jgi:hypothetical protein
VVVGGVLLSVAAAFVTLGATSTTTDDSCDTVSSPNTDFLWAALGLGLGGLPCLVDGIVRLATHKTTYRAVDRPGVVVDARSGRGLLLRF